MHLKGRISYVSGKLLFAAATVFFMVSCSTTTQMYSGPARPASETAVIRGVDRSISIVRCDGTKVASNAASVLPGSHTVETTFQDDFVYMNGTTLLGWKAEPGHTYTIHNKQHMDRPGIWVSMFIIDLANGKEVSTSLYKPGEERERLQLMEQKIKEMPSDGYLWLTKSYYLIRLQRHSEAMQALDTAINLQPNNVDAWSLKSLALFQQAQYEGSLTAINKAIQLQNRESDKKAREEILKKIEENKKRSETATP